MAARGHVLLVDVPGVGKTQLVKALAAAIDLQFSRVQFTPDLLPLDVTGASVCDPRDKRFVFRPGPVFTNLLLADEINRATPKTQSALLEVMEERSVTVDGTTHVLAAAVPGAGDDEPARPRGHLRAAGGADRSLHGDARDGLPVGRRRGAHARSPPRSRSRRWRR